MNGASRVALPLDATLELNTRLPSLLRHVAGIFRLSDDGLVHSKGSGVLVKLDGRRLVFTAKHVVDGALLPATNAVLGVFPLTPDGTATPRLFVTPQRHRLYKSSMIWSHAGLDGAALALQDLDDLPPEHFLDGDYHARIASAVTRDDWKTLTTPDSAVPFTVHGFPNFGSSVDNDHRVQMLSCYSTIAEVTAWSDAPWSPLATLAPQCHFEAASIDGTSLIPGLTDWETQLANQARGTASEVGNEGFGGISGGPIFRAAGDGDFLSAIVKEGGRSFGSTVRFIGTPWDDLLSAFKSWS